VDLEEVLDNVEYAIGFSNLNARRAIGRSREPRGRRREPDSEGSQSILGDAEEPDEGGSRRQSLRPGRPHAEKTDSFETTSDDVASSFSQSFAMSSDFGASQAGDHTIDDFKEKLQLFKGRDHQ
jgi:hypothetical protein